MARLEPCRRTGAPGILHLPKPPPTRNELVGYLHQPGLQALAASAINCELCDLINESFAKCISAYRKAEQDPVFVYYNTSKGFSVDSQLWLTSRLDHGDGFLAFVRARLKASIFLVGAVGICWRTLRATQSEAQSDCKVMRHPDSPLASIFRRPPVEVEAEAEKILNRATAWIQNCVEKREHCNVITAPLPSRLPDLDCSSNINVIRLWETEGARGHYATLSHCWGDAGHFTTSCASIAARK